jgi:hypothetical protein
VQAFVHVDRGGDIGWIRLDVGDDAEGPDHYIGEGEHLETILGRQ